MNTKYASFFICLLFFGLSFSTRKDQASYQSAFEAYRDTIPGTTVAFDMISIVGGKFQMGSPVNEKGHREDEGPVHTVQVDSFWIGKNEITWDEYELFVFPELEKENKTLPVGVDAVSRPTPPYVDMSFGMEREVILQ